MEVINTILTKQNIPVPAKCLPNIFLYIYESFLEELDAIDNGIPMSIEGKPLYRINTHLSARVHRLNPKWNSPESSSPDALFKEAMDLVGKEFLEIVIEVNTSSFLCGPLFRFL